MTDKQAKIKNAIAIGTLCATSYLAIYYARNILSAVTPQMIEKEGFSTELIGSVSSVYFVLYAFGQLINGMIGDRVKARYMISFGLVFAGICNFLFSRFAGEALVAHIVYGLTGFFLSMIYAPMTKVVAENTDPIYATRCTLGYTFSSFFGTPLAGAAAMVMTWQGVFFSSSTALLLMGILCFIIFLFFEKKGIVRYNQFQRKNEGKTGGIRLLIQRKIILFTFISVLTGIVRTSVVFWMPTYLAQYLGFSTEHAALIFTISTFIISLTPVVSVFIYEKIFLFLMERAILCAFSLSAVFFLLVRLIALPAINIALLALAIICSGIAASMLYSRYCPSLRDTGMVSSATGFLDFVSYMSAAFANTVFANAATSIGWGNLILVWFGLLATGAIVCLKDGLRPSQTPNISI